ncbi:hypothetical protein PHLCEN_2v2704 [Hermanssonia centrifuga]|uniref:Uncharacterized protein n=1 Tax=Hermanssonia centrifuga TaxID=98765 RepID=A0A2R6RII0_9APHY|nr:hypothetical protein PHLCEN_2v2704 [Hermanssonia centrifuga]
MSDVLDKSMIARPQAGAHQNSSVSSLHPKLITRECYLDFSHARRPHVYYGTATYSNLVDYGRVHQQQYRFPEGTHGFLYYHSPEWAPRLAGQLRFRITSSPNPASFSSGTDLKWHGIPWQRPLLALSRLRDFDAMEDILLRDGLVSKDTLLACDKSATLRSGVYGSSRLIYAFGQPFHMKLGWVFKLCVINTSGDKESTVDVLWWLPRIDVRKPMYPNGSAICCFELSKLPEHEGTRSIVIRVLKVVEPIIRTPQDVSDLHLPEIVEGGLLMKNMTEVIRYEVPEDEKRIHVLDKWGLRYLKEYPEAVGSFWPPSP